MAPETALHQILTLNIPEAQELADEKSQQYQIWSEVLRCIEHSNNVEYILWGLGVERYWEAQIHVVRSSMKAHQAYLASDAHANVLDLLSGLTKKAPTVRHATIQQFTPGAPPFDAPFTGTAVYLECQPKLWDAAWSLWTQIVPTVDGCSGVAGGYVHEDVEGKTHPYLVYVGWEDIERHESFHQSALFRRYRVVLDTGNTGWTEYGHVRFIETRDSRFPPHL